MAARRIGDCTGDRVACRAGRVADGRSPASARADPADSDHRAVGTAARCAAGCTTDAARTNASASTGAACASSQARATRAQTCRVAQAQGAAQNRNEQTCRQTCCAGTFRRGAHTGTCCSASAKTCTSGTTDHHRADRPGRLPEQSAAGLPACRRAPPSGRHDDAARACAAQRTY